jgi:hypothetical protein
MQMTSTPTLLFLALVTVSSACSSTDDRGAPADDSALPTADADAMGADTVPPDTVGSDTVTTDAPGGDATKTDAAAGESLSAKYPGDLGIDKDPDVLWAESFEEGSIDAVTARYDSHANAPGMSLVADVPSKSSGKASMKMTAGGAASATDLYKLLPNQDEMYVRWYVKYEAAIPWHHSGMWFGGYAPPTKYPNPRAGLKPVGDDRVSFAIEPVFDVGKPTIRLDTYDYWMNMHSWMDVPSGTTAYYGNATINQKSFTVDEGAWMCLEAHVKLNTDLASSKGAVMDVWKNDALVQHYDETSPLGYWVKDKFCPDAADGPECTAYRPAGATLAPENLQFRSSSALQLNHFWPQNYITDTRTGSLWFDDMVVAKVRVGCLR